MKFLLAFILPIIFLYGAITSPNYNNPTITSINCISGQMVVQWDYPQTPPDTMFPGTAWVHNGDYNLQYVALNRLQGDGDPHWVWTGYLEGLSNYHGWIIEDGWITVLTPAGHVSFVNTPYPITCEGRVYLPLQVLEGD